MGKVEKYGTNRKGWPVSDEDLRKWAFAVYFEQLDEGVEGVMKTRKSSSNDSELGSSHRQAILLTAKCLTDAHLKITRSCLAGAADTQAVPGCVQTLPVAAERVDYVMDGEVGGQVVGDNQLEGGSHLHLVLVGKLHKVTWGWPESSKERVRHSRQVDLGSGSDLKRLLLDVSNLIFLLF